MQHATHALDSMIFNLVSDLKSTRIIEDGVILDVELDSKETTLSGKNLNNCMHVNDITS